MTTHEPCQGSCLKDIPKIYKCQFTWKHRAVFCHYYTINRKCFVFLVWLNNKRRKTNTQYSLTTLLCNKPRPTNSIGQPFIYRTVLRKHQNIFAFSVTASSWRQHKKLKLFVIGRRQRPVYHTQSIPWLLMTRQSKEVINSHGIDLVYWESSGLSTRMVKCFNILKMSLAILKIPSHQLSIKILLGE